jgi:halocyanin-like protein
MKGAVVVGDVTVGGNGGDAAAGEPDYGDWFDDVGNYDGTFDARDRAAVAVEVGANVDGVPFGFEPAAVRVSPGTTVTWEWTGEGGAHDVAAVDGSFGSALVDEPGHTFTHTFESAGVYRYACTPHEPLGMKGAVVVGDPVAQTRAAADRDLALVGLLAGAVMAALFLIPVAELRRGGRRHSPPT